jgi:ribosomal protein S3AE
MPDVPKIKSTNPKDHLHSKLVEQFTAMSLLDINSLYRAAHYLKIRSMKRSIAAFLACRVYISTKDSYRLRISELAVSKEISV